MKSIFSSHECNLFVERFCSKKEWVKKKKEHKSLILDKFSKDHKFEELFFIKLQKLEKIYMGIGIQK